MTSQSTPVKTKVCNDTNPTTPAPSTSKKEFFDVKTDVSETKHGVLNSYMGAWLAKLFLNKVWKRYYQHIVYVDGFAGPGRYANEKDGSPIVIYNLALTHTALRENGPEIYLIFNEKDKKQCEQLLENLNSLRMANAKAKNANKVKYMVIQGEFVKSLEWILSSAFEFPTGLFWEQFHNAPVEKQEPATNLFIGQDTPFFVFVDPFGYRGQYMPMTLMREIFERSSKSEVLINLMTGFLRRFFNLDSRARAINLLVGDNENDATWKPMILAEPDSQEKLKTFLKFYDDQLSKGYSSSRYTCLFETRDIKNRLLYNLYFASHHPDGFTAMKNAMRKQSQNEEIFKFSAFDAKNPDFEPEKISIVELKKKIVDEFKEKGKVYGRDISSYLDGSPTHTQRHRISLKKELEPFCVSPSPRKRLRFDDIEYDFQLSETKKKQKQSTLKDFYCVNK